MSTLDMPAVQPATQPDTKPATQPGTEPAPESAPEHGRLPDDLAVVVPGDWWVVDLADDERAKRSIDGLVARQFKGVDNQPIVKNQVRTRFRVQASRAREAGGRRMAVSLMDVAGLPVTASFTTYLMSLGLPAHAASHVDEVYADLTRPGLPGPAPRLDFTELGAGKTLRRMRVRTEEDDPVEIAEGVELLLVDYWIEMPDHLGMAQLAFSTAMARWPEQMTELFDAIVSTAQWVFATEA